MAKFAKTYAVASAIGIGMYALGSLALCAYAEAWVPGGGYDAISLDRADRQDRADRLERARDILGKYPAGTEHYGLEKSQGGGGRRPDSFGSRYSGGSDSGAGTGDQGRDSGGD